MANLDSEARRIENVQKYLQKKKRKGTKEKHGEKKKELYYTAYLC